MKNLWNRWGVITAAPMSHVVPLGAELATPEDKAPLGADEDLAAESPQPVTPLRAVPVMPSPQGRHTFQMADIAVLEAHNERLSRMTAQSEAQAERLRSDLERNNTLSQLVTNRQRQLRGEIGQIEAQRVATQAQLNKTLRQVQQLKAANNEGIPRISNR